MGLKAVLWLFTSCKGLRIKGNYPSNEGLLFPWLF